MRCLVIDLGRRFKDSFQKALSARITEVANIRGFLRGYACNPCDLWEISLNLRQVR